MANWPKIFRVSGCLILTAGFVLISPGLFLGAMLTAGSERTIYERAESPNGSHEARVQFDDGGALSGFERLVFVKSTWNPSDAPLLSCRAFWGHGQADIDLSWQDETTLVIEHHVAPDNVAHVESNCGSVRIVTSAVEPFEDF